MNPIVRNLLATIAGIVVGSLVNIGLINIGPSVIPVPEGADVSTMDGLRDSIDLFTPANFLFPFLAHALGTSSGAFIAAKLAISHQMKFAVVISVFFLAGGITAASMLGGPAWFTVSDLLFAYVPMGLLGGFLAGGKKPPAA